MDARRAAAASPGICAAASQASVPPQQKPTIATLPAEAVVRLLELQRHPEGGWYRETWRDQPTDGRRGAGTSILFLLEAGQRSHWHRIDAAKL